MQTIPDYSGLAVVVRRIHPQSGKHQAIVSTTNPTVVRTTVEAIANSLTSPPRTDTDGLEGQGAREAVNAPA
jgi:hypothetical protein